VLGTVGAYRALLGKNQDWTFAVYLPVLLACFVLAVFLARLGRAAQNQHDRAVI
jgi:hypothetical protein